MTAHTPGPWSAFESTEDCPFPSGVCVAVGTAAGNGAHGSIIASMIAQGTNGRYSPEVTSANARLIAAAPDLLEALLGEVGGLRTDCNERKCGTCSRCRSYAAIAKAEGR